MPAEDDALAAEIILEEGWLDREQIRRAVEAHFGANLPRLPLVDLLSQAALLSGEQSGQLREQLAQARVATPTQGPHPAPPLPHETPPRGPPPPDAAAPDEPTAPPPLTVPPSEERPSSVPPPLPSTWAQLGPYRAIVWAALGTLIIVSIYALARRPRRGPAEPPRATARERGAPRADAPPPRAPKPPLAAETAAAAAALAFERAHPKAHGPALLRLRRALLAIETPEAAEPVATRLAERRRALDDGARAALAQLDQRLDALRRADRFGDAFAACGAFPAELRHGAWGEQFAERLAALAWAADARRAELVLAGAKALVARRFDDAPRAYEQLGRLGIPWVAKPAEGLVAACHAYVTAEGERVGRAVEAREKATRRAMFGRLTGLFAKAFALLEAHRHAEALALVRTAPEALREGHTGAALVRLAERIGLLDTLWQAVALGPAAAKGKPFRLRGIKGIIEGFGGPAHDRHIRVRFGSGASAPVRRESLRKLSTSQLAQLGQWAVADEPRAEAALAVALLLLPGDDRKATVAKLDEAERHGARTAPYRDELAAKDLVAKALAAHRAEEWAAARKLLEAALDDHADAAPVILAHRALVKALTQCLDELGEPAGPKPLEPVPLPLELRVLRLLPETRLGPAPPNDPSKLYLGPPLERASPLVFGANGWRDCHISIDYTLDRGSGFVLLARLSGPRSGRFAYNYLAIDGTRVVVGRHNLRGHERLAVKRVPELLVPRRHRVIFTLLGGELSVRVNDKRVLDARDATLAGGRVALASGDAELRIHQLSLLFPSPPPPKAPARKPPPPTPTHTP